MKLRFASLVVLAAFAVSLISGCATDKSLGTTDRQNISSLKLTRYESPPILRMTTGAKAALITGVMFGAVGGAVGGGIGQSIATRRGKELTEQCSLPDFGEVMTQTFADQIRRELPDWSNLTIEQEVVTDESLGNMTGYVATVKVILTSVDDGNGLCTMTDLKIIGPE